MNWYYFRNSSEKFIRFLEKEYFIIQEKEFTKKFDIGRGGSRTEFLGGPLSGCISFNE